MVIGKHGGSNGQRLYVDDGPGGHGDPAWFNALVFGLFRYYFAYERRGWKVTAVYITDYSLVGDEPAERDGQSYMPAPTAAETFGDAAAMAYVMESDVFGGTGPERHSFSAAADTRALVEAHSGRTVTVDEITPQLMARYTTR
ncbi:MAG: nitrous oxide reductase accessory protein NosL [Haloplanus sp.]